MSLQRPSPERIHVDMRRLLACEDRVDAALVDWRNACLARTKLRSTTVPRMLRNLARSYGVAWRAKRSAPAGQYLVVHYEELVADEAATMARVGDFLGLDRHDGLTQQTIMRHAAEANSSFHGMTRTSFRPSPMAEHLFLTLARLCHRPPADEIDACGANGTGQRWRPVAAKSSPQPKVKL